MKKRVAVLFGGKSAEHEVSLQSALNVLRALDREKYDVIPIGIDKRGQWYVGDEGHLMLNSDDPSQIAIARTDRDLTIAPGKSSSLLVPGEFDLGKIDVVFPVVHGPYGEDGSLQGLLKLADIACVGSGVLGSAVGMDKDIMKRLLRDAGIPIAKWILAQRHDSDLSFETIAAELGSPVYVKPANLGSSVGVHRVSDAKQFRAALADAFLYDTRVIIEEEILGREVECAILGNEDPRTSVIGEVVTDYDFYSYEAKYIDTDGSRTVIPADLSQELVDQLQEISKKTFQTLCCAGLSRVDSFVTDDGEIYVNEINTLPGFTDISMYPKLWEASGLSQSQLVDELIALAIARHTKEASLKSVWVG